MPQVQAEKPKGLGEFQEPITADEYLEMRDTPPGELVEGEIVQMGYTSWEHAQIEATISRKLGNFIEAQNVNGRVLAGDAGICTARDPDTVRGADVVFISAERFAENASETLIDIGPELIVQIVSPSNTWKNVRDKIREYFDIGTDRVWIVEPENEAVLVFRSPTDLQELSAGKTLKGEGPLEDFSVPVASLFA